MIAGKINGKKVPWESPLTICFSAVAMDPVLAISVNASYMYDKEKSAFAFANASTNEKWDGKPGINNGKGMHEWAKGMFRDMFS